MNKEDIEAETDKFNFGVDIPKYVEVTKKVANPFYLKMRRHLSKTPLRVLAEKLNVTVAFLSAVESGKKSCPEYVLFEYESLNVSEFTKAKAFTGRVILSK